ncbi:MAG: metallopeptidase family protein [Gemmatimonadales bacterium]
MQLPDFRSLVERLARDIPPQFQGGVVAVEVSPQTVPHPARADVYTLGECIPLEWSGDGADLQSRIVLYHGSFQALARQGRGDFDWRAETWETLTHELRHHLEWRANTAALEAYDWAAEQNFARHEGHPFDPVFYRLGDRLAPNVWKVDDDVFIEGEPDRLPWHGRRYRVLPPAAGWPAAPAFLTLAGLLEPPPGDALLVIPGRFSLAGLWRRRRQLTRAAVCVEPLDD